MNKEFDLAIKNKKNGMVITSSTCPDDDGIMGAPLLPGKSFLMIRGFSGYSSTLEDFSWQLTDEEREYAKVDLFNFVQTVTGDDNIDPRPFNESFDEYDDINQEELQTWKEILKEKLPNYDIYTLDVYEHSAVAFYIRTLDESSEDFQKIDGLILLDKQHQLPKKYDEMLSDWWNGWYVQLDLYEPNDDGNYDFIDGIGTIFQSEDDFSYQGSVTKMLETAININLSDATFDPKPEDWEVCEPNVSTITVYDFK